MAVTKAENTILRKNSTGSEFRRRRLNFIEGSNVTLTVSDDSANNEVDVTIASSGGSGTPIYFNVKTYGAVGNGSTDDSSAIQDAIDAAELVGGAVFIPEGTYIIDTDLVIDSNNVQILGAGRGSILKAKASTDVNVIKVSGADHILIQDIAVDGNKTNIDPITPGTQYILENAIWITGCNDVTVTRCHIHDHAAGGIIADNSTHLIFTENYIENGVDNGIFLRPETDGADVACADVTIANNIVHDMDFSGIQAIKSNNITISGNVSYNNGPSASQGDGIGVEGCEYVTIQGNICYNNGIQGINCRQTEEGVVSPLGSSHIVITGNVVYGHSSTNGDSGGILILATDDVVCSNNLLYDNYFNINIAAGSSIDSTNIKLSGNRLQDSGDTGIRIVLDTASDILISDNQVCDSVGHGLYTDQRVWIQGGVFKGSSGSGKNGVVFDTGSDGSVITDAYIYDNNDNGILVNGTAANIEVINCFFDNVGGTQGRGLYEASGAGPTRIINSRIINQTNEPYHFDDGSSFYSFITSLTDLGVTSTATELNYTDGVTSSIQTQLDAMVEKAGDTMTGDLTMSSTSVVLTPAPSADVTESGIIAPMTAGESLVFGDVTYVKSDGKMGKTDADAVATSYAVAMALGTIANDASGNFLFSGFVRNDAWAWTVGGVIYLSTTAGALTQTAPSATDNAIVPVGVATHADRMFFNPSLRTVVHT